MQVHLNLDAKGYLLRLDAKGMRTGFNCVHWGPVVSTLPLCFSLMTGQQLNIESNSHTLPLTLLTDCVKLTGRLTPYGKKTINSWLFKVNW